VGGKYSIADIASWGWINGLLFTGIDLDFFPNVKAWWARIAARPAVERGLSVPRKGPFGNATYAKKLEEDEEFRKKEEEVKELVKKAKEQYGYKYASP
jgi:glutathione S-transferase